MEENDFGITLEKLLKERKMTIGKLAKEIGVSPTTLKEYVGRGGRFPSKPHVLKKIAEVFELSIHELLFGEPDPMATIPQALEMTDFFNGTFEVSIRRVNVKQSAEKKRG
jgi:transcriptional regulator with XRE-family HTH domain